MQLFDQKWGLRIRDLGLVTWLVGRYMDDIRVFLPPTKIGWRMWEGKLQYCKKWAIQDQNLSPVERTKRVVGDTFQGVEYYLHFTTETC